MIVLTGQAEAQVRAALIFWQNMAAISRVHPSRHPAVRACFNGHSPLTIREIEELFATWDTQRYTVPQMARYLGVSKVAVQKVIDRLGVTAAVHRPKWLYEGRDMARVAQVIFKDQQA